MRRALLLALALALAGCRGPFLLMSGGALDGPVKPAPASMAFAQDAGTIQLETRPQDPYSVNVAVAVAGDAAWVSAGDSRTNWVENIEANPQVRARIRGDVYELRARRVTDPEEMRTFAATWLALGSWARDPLRLEEVWVYRLEPR